MSRDVCPFPFFPRSAFQILFVAPPISLGKKNVVHRTVQFGPQRHRMAVAILIFGRAIRWFPRVEPKDPKVTYAASEFVSLCDLFLNLRRGRPDASEKREKHHAVIERSTRRVGATIA